MYNVGIVGIGRIGWKIEFGEVSEKPFAGADPMRVRPNSHYGAFSSNPETKVVAVADTDENTLMQFKSQNHDVSCYTDYEEMLSKQKIDILSVCTPVSTHCKIVRNAVRFDPVKLIFCEKPMASTVQECQQMIDTAKEFKVALAVNFTRRWDDVYTEAKKTIDSKTLGDVTQIIGYASREKDFDGNIHMFDLLNWFTGDKPGYVEKWDITRTPDGSISKITINNDVIPDDADKRLKSTYVDCYPADYLIFELDIILSKGRIQVIDNGRQTTIRRSEQSTHYAGLNELDHYPDTIRDKSIQFSHATPMANAVKNIVDFLNARGKNPCIPLKCTGEMGLNAQVAYGNMEREDVMTDCYHLFDGYTPDFSQGHCIKCNQWVKIGDSYVVKKEE